MGPRRADAVLLDDNSQHMSGATKASCAQQYGFAMGAFVAIASCRNRVPDPLGRSHGRPSPASSSDACSSPPRWTAWSWTYFGVDWRVGHVARPGWPRPASPWRRVRPHSRRRGAVFMRPLMIARSSLSSRYRHVARRNSTRSRATRAEPRCSEAVAGLLVCFVRDRGS